MTSSDSFGRFVMSNRNAAYAIASDKYNRALFLFVRLVDTCPETSLEDEMEMNPRIIYAGLLSNVFKVAVFLRNEDKTPEEVREFVFHENKNSDNLLKFTNMALEMLETCQLSDQETTAFLDTIEGAFQEAKGAK